MDYATLFRGFPGAVTVCDREGVILAMNDRAIETFAGGGGDRLLGTSVFSCHPEPARTKLQALQPRAVRMSTRSRKTASGN